MNVGTIPLIVHVPEIAPIRNRMTMAVVTSPMLFLISSSKTSHGTLNSHIASQIAIPAENNNATWLAPRIASLPKMLMFNAKNTIRTRIGIREIPIRYIVIFFIIISPFSKSSAI